MGCMCSDWLSQKQEPSQGPGGQGIMIGSPLLKNLVGSVERTFPPVKGVLVPEEGDKGMLGSRNNILSLPILLPMRQTNPQAQVEPWLSHGILALERTMTSSLLQYLISQSCSHLCQKLNNPWQSAFWSAERAF